MGESSNDLAFKSVNLQQLPIKKITIFSGEWGRIAGFKIIYRCYVWCSADLINKASPHESGSINFHENDVLVGMTYSHYSTNSKDLEKLGFTVIRDGQIYQYAPIGNDLKKLEVWPELKTLKDN